MVKGHSWKICRHFDKGDNIPDFTPCSPFRKGSILKKKTKKKKKNKKQKTKKTKKQKNKQKNRKQKNKNLLPKAVNSFRLDPFTEGRKKQNNFDKAVPLESVSIPL